MRSKMEGLQVGNYSMGERLIQGGEYEHLTSMGTLDAKQANIHSLNVLGDASIVDCYIEVLQIAGSVHMLRGRIDMASVAGELIIEDVDCGSLHVLGELHARSSTCRILRFGKNTNKGLFVFAPRQKGLLQGEIKGETLENFFPLTLTKEQVFDYIINCGQLFANVDIECRKFFSFSLLSAHEINADMIYLYPCASVSVQELHGSLVIIDPSFDEAWLHGIAMDVDVSQLYNHASCRSIRVHTIEADEVILDYVNCDIVRAKKVVIGPHANIKRIEYEECCDVHKDALVREIVQI